MSNETPFRPCPMCGGWGYQNDYLVSTGMVACAGDCAIELPVGVWDTLSDAAALARAVERIGHELAAGGLELSVWESMAGVTAALVKMRYTATVPLHQAGQRDDIAAALIAVAEQVNE